MAPKKGKKEKEPEPPPPPPPAEEEPAEDAEPPPPDPMEDTCLTTGLELPLRPREVDQVWAAKGGYEEQGRLLEGFFRLREEFPVVAQREIICDFHLYNLAHAKSICFSARQGAVFLAIMANIMNMMRSKRDANNRPRAEEASSALVCFKEFERLVLQHSMNDPPERLQIFRGSEARMLTDFASATLFKHFLLYQFCSSNEQEAQVLPFHVAVQRPLQVPDLNLARKQRRKSRDGEELGTQGLGDLTQGAAGEEEQEEDEIERLVQEKLRETEARMQAQLDEREEAFKQMLKSRPEPKAKAKR